MLWLLLNLIAMLISQFIWPLIGANSMVTMVGSSTLLWLTTSTIRILWSFRYVFETMIALLNIHLLRQSHGDESLVFANLDGRRLTKSLFVLSLPGLIICGIRNIFDTYTIGLLVFNVSIIAIYAAEMAVITSVSLWKHWSDSIKKYLTTEAVE